MVIKILVFFVAFGWWFKIIQSCIWKINSYVPELEKIDKCDDNKKRLCKKLDILSKDLWLIFSIYVISIFFVIVNFACMGIGLTLNNNDLNSNVQVYQESVVE